MRSLERDRLARVFAALISSMVLTAIAYAGWLDDLDARLSDRYYQRPSARSSDIVVVGIDKVTLSKLEPIQSLGREQFATVIDRLNADPEARPAVIGIDVLFTGEKADDPEGDRRLAAEAARGGNVVVASEADVFDDDSDDIRAPQTRTWEWIPPYAALNAATETGHINAPNEVDGIVRHDLLFVNVGELGKLYSFSRVICEKWCAVEGITPSAPPRTENDGIFYLPFTSESYASGKNFFDVLEGAFEPEFFRDKIVLIAPYAPGLMDSAPTALNRSDVMFGIDVHANAIEAFRRGFFPREVDRTSQSALMFALSFVAAMLFRNGKVAHMVLTWLMFGASRLILCEACYRHELILNVLWLPFSTSILLTGSPDELDARGSLRNIAVLFVDIRGFTSMSEELPAPTVVEILNRYLTLTTECVRRHHGTLDKFVGDCTMAFWNAPVEQDQPVYLACRAAVDMIKGSEELRREIRAEYGRDIAFGIGVHWGSAVVGNIGTEFRMDYTAIGDTVNTAARIESNAPGGVILISRAVADELGARADVTSLGTEIKLKGKRADFEVLRLNSMMETEGV